MNQFNIYASVIVLLFLCDQGFSDIIICEGQSAYIHCKWPRHRIQIYQAIYGRTTGRIVCPHPSIRTHNCRSSVSNRKIKLQCNRRSLCKLDSNNHQFGDPCYGTYKYLEVKYKCSVCPHPSIRTHYCRSSVSIRKIKWQCNRRSPCKLESKNHQFGDPCNGTYKYLKVNYKCK
ncbi:L-rhamnose-binding lectin ELEL-1-like [Mytilus edulis]|uniref:L-rhamnose-binding lectin ELEL-1-like n=1 Tax=Mytilus edulis TaxID=6550 RepID=UPI0039F0F782